MSDINSGDHTKRSGEVLGSAARAASYNMVAQVLIRVVSFLLNGVILRYTSRDMLGLVNVRLFLLYTTGQFVCREAFRRACLTYGQKIDVRDDDDGGDGASDNDDGASDNDDGDGQRSDDVTPSSQESDVVDEKVEWFEVVNVMWLQLPLSLLVMPALAYVWMYWLDLPSPSSTSSPSSLTSSPLSDGYPIAVIVYSLCVVVEMVAAPLLTTSQIFLIVHLQVLEVSTSVVIKSVITVALLIVAPHLGLYTFCIAQVVQSAYSIAVYYLYFLYVARRRQRDEKKHDRCDGDWPVREFRDLFPRFSTAHQHVARINRGILRLVGSFFKQGLLKMLLTEGERYVMTFFHLLSLESQGLYDVVSNLGSLSARLILLPIEDAAYLFFTHTLERGSPAPEQDRGALELSCRVLSQLVRLVSLTALIIVSFGANYSFILLHLYGGETLSSGAGPLLLRSHSFYILLLAVNGVTEAFVFALMSAREVERYNGKMVGFSIIFLASSYYLTLTWGSVGFLLGNCVNMSLRIGHSISYIRTYLRPTNHGPLLHSLPRAGTAVVFVVVTTAITVSSVTLCCPTPLLSSIHVGVGAVAGLSLLAVLYHTESDLVNFMLMMWREKKIR